MPPPADRITDANAPDAGPPAADRLDDQREWFRVALSSIGDAVITTDAGGTVTWLNPVAETLTGWAQADATGRPLDAVFHIVNERTRLPVENPALRALRDGAVVGLANHTILVARDGAERAIDDSAAPIRDAANRVIGAVLVFRDITERLAGERKLVESAALKAAILETALDCIITMDHAGKVVDFNPAAERTFGHRRAAAIGRDLGDLIVPPAMRPLHHKGMAHYLATGEGPVLNKRLELSALHADGTEFPVELTVTRIPGAGPPLFTAYLRDITERARAAAELAERMNLLALSADVGAALVQGETVRDTLQRCAAAIVDRLDGAFARIWTHDAAAGVLELQASAGLYTHTDGPHGRVPVGQFKIGLIARERTPHLTNAVVGDPRVPEQAWAAREGMVSFAGYPLIVGDRLVGVMAMFARHALSAHTLDAMAAVANEVAVGIERMAAQAEVARLLERERARADRLRELAGASLTLNSATTPASIVGVVQAEARRITGARHADVALLPNHSALAGGLAAPLIGRGGQPFGELLVADKAEGGFTEEDGAVLTQLAHMTAVALDNARLYQELRETDRRKDEFLATLAHELRNPLAPIRNALQILKLAGANPAAAADSRAMIERQVGQMVRLIDDLMDLSRINQGKIQLKKERIDLATVLTSAVETSRPLIEAAGHRLTVTLPPEPIIVFADLTRLAQVFLNLLNNAAKYTERGGDIRLTADRDGEGVAVTVKDSGVGIPAEMLPRIFEMFTQVERSLEKSQGGLGIGLTLVRRLTDMHGGTVEARSDGPGKGSEFTVRLPVSSDARSASATSGFAGESPGARRPRRILAVDDNRDSADSLAAMLRLLGNDVRTAYDGMEAVSAAAAFRPELVLLDIGLPRLNGYDAARRMREQSGGERIVLVALTGWGQESDRERSKAAGFDHHLVKPVDPAALEKVLSELRPVSGER